MPWCKHAANGTRGMSHNVRIGSKTLCQTVLYPSAGYGGMNGDGRGRREEKEGRKEGRGEGKRKEGVKGLVSCLHDGGYSHQLAWLEAYLNDEARDRRLDGM